MADELIYQTFINRVRRLRRAPGRPRRGPRPALHGELSRMAELIGLPEPPRARRDRALPAGTFDGAGRVRHRRRHRPGQGHRGRVRPPRRRHRRSPAASPSTSTPAGEAIEALGAPVLTVACDIREPDSIAAAFDARRGRVRPARRAGQQRRGQLPGAGRGHVAQRVAHRRRHHAQRHVLLRPRVRPPPPRGRARPGRSSTSARPTPGPAGPGFAHSAAAKAGVKNLIEIARRRVGPVRDPGQRARARASSRTRT